MNFLALMSSKETLFNALNVNTESIREPVLTDSPNDCETRVPKGPFLFPITMFVFNRLVILIGLFIKNRFSDFLDKTKLCLYFELFEFWGKYNFKLTKTKQQFQNRSTQFWPAY